jgi:hypothetical protein
VPLRAVVSEATRGLVLAGARERVWEGRLLARAWGLGLAMGWVLV